MKITTKPNPLAAQLDPDAPVIDQDLDNVRKHRDENAEIQRLHSFMIEVMRPI